MVVVNILHMTSGNGESSYANNSSFQESIIQKSLPILKDAINGISNREVFGQCFKIADLGCSSGKNTLVVASNIIDIVYEMCKENNKKEPQFQVYLNDLFGNDFNNLFKLLPDFYANLTKEGGQIFGRCFIAAVPGSFYDRLFPDESMHLIHSSTSVHWLSQVPVGLENNRLNIYLAKTSPENVIQAYAKQFYDDFTKFVRLRSQELVCGGSLVLAFSGRNTVDPPDDETSVFWELLAQSLFSMLEENKNQGKFETLVLRAIRYISDESLRLRSFAQSPAIRFSSGHPPHLEPYELSPDLRFHVIREPHFENNCC